VFDFSSGSGGLLDFIFAGSPCQGFSLAEKPMLHDFFMQMERKRFKALL
jgi:site-specific DNA-cytosine methylase